MINNTVNNVGVPTRNGNTPQPGSLQQQPKNQEGNPLRVATLLFCFFHYYVIFPRIQATKQIMKKSKLDSNKTSISTIKPKAL